MKSVIIIAIAFVLLFIPLDIFAQDDNESGNNVIRNGTDTWAFEESTSAPIPNTTIQNRIQTSESNTLIIGIIGIVVSGVSGIIGFLLGKRQSKNLLELILKAFNIERQIKDMDDPELFLEGDTVKGRGTFTSSLTVRANVIDLKNKKIIGEKGIRDMTPEEAEKYGKRSPT